ncbi:hypothetical protein H6P81_017771 [Aristolochia fimbriata]|uniref:Uncharacterized protein n=1 Tax=Aristolochia fimbriata TaxID=158543 RepID=A0AAV7E262_ARIFI|nr:hypothetical protein H6P81_017771 [Aristolochia fimbriata]
MLSASASASHSSPLLSLSSSVFRLADFRLRLFRAFLRVAQVQSLKVSPSLSSKSQSCVEARFPLQEYFVPRPSCPRKTVGDRFIPLRSAMDFDMARYLLTESRKERELLCGFSLQRSLSKGCVD